MSGAAVGIASAVISMVGSAASASAQASAANQRNAYARYQAEVARSEAMYNRDVAEANAKTAELEAAAEEARFRREAEKVQSTQKVRMLASGRQLTGSALDVIEDDAKEAELDALNIRYGGKSKALAYRQSATLQNWRANTIKAETSDTSMAGVGTLLTGAGKAVGGMGSALS